MNKHMSLVEQVLTPQMRAILATRKTTNGVTLDDVIRSGVENPDSKVGAYAPDQESYTVFDLLFDALIEKYHGFGPDQKHVSSFDISKRDVDNVDPEGKYILSTRIRVARNIASFPFPGAITLKQRLEQEALLSAFLNTLTGDLAGKYESLKTMSESRKAELDKAHLLFQQEPDPYLDSARITSNYPSGRGMFLCEGNTAGVWGQEEDGLRIWALEKGSDFRRIFGRLSRLIQLLEDNLGFAKSERYGYLTSCPTNVGTGMRASVMIKLPHLGKDEAEFKAICADMKLAVRGIAGEHSKSEGGIFDISNKARLGSSEADIVELVAQGAKKLIALEQIQEQKAA
jgi:protein-arginine kinase